MNNRTKTDSIKYPLRFAPILKQRVWGGIKYTPEDKALWNNFVMSSKNGTFLFHRDFMDYHSDRFEDHSLIVYKKNKVVGVFPANVIENKVYSHQGLSYGGIILKTSVKFKETALIFKSILKYLDNETN